MQWGLGGVSLLGTRGNAETQALLADHDVLLLPSVYDGWGAVVNEALMLGLYVICSSRCGAKELLHSPVRGCVYPAGNVKALAACMADVAGRVEQVRAQVPVRRAWANEHIGGQALARYMVDCLSGNQPARPWATD